MTPRRAAAVGLFFLVDAIVYFVAPHLFNGVIDYAGATMLVALGAAMAIMAYVLIAGQSRG